MDVEGKMKSFLDSVKGSVSHFTESILQRFNHAGLGAHQQLEDNKKIIASGVLRKLKRRKGRSSWRLVYVIVDENCLSYYEDETSDHPMGTVLLQGYNRVTRLDENDTVRTAFAIVPDTPDHSKVYTFATISLEERKEWMESIRNALIKANAARAETTQKTITTQKTVTASKQVGLQHKPRLPSPPVNKHNDELEDIEQPVYEVINEGDMAATTSKTAHVTDEEHNSSSTSDSDATSNYLPPYAAGNRSINAGQHSSGFRPISSPPPRPRRDLTDGPIQKPKVKPTLPPKPPTSSEPSSDLQSNNQSNDRPRHSKKTVNQSQQVSQALVHEIKHAQNALLAEPGSLFKGTLKKTRIYWSGPSDEAFSAIQASSECGTYLIRNSEQDESILVLVVLNEDGRSRKLRLCRHEDPDDGLKKWCLAINASLNFDSLEELVKYYSDEPISIGGKQTKLTRPLEHERMTALPPHLKRATKETERRSQ